MYSSHEFRVYYLGMEFMPNFRFNTEEAAEAFIAKTLSWLDATREDFTIKGRS